MRARSPVWSVTSSITFNIWPIACERFPRRLTTVDAASTVALILSMPLIAASAAAIPRSEASCETLSARLADSPARCSTSFIEALISVSEEDVSSAEEESASVFSDTCRAEASISCMDDAVSSAIAESPFVLLAISPIEVAISATADDALVAEFDITSALSATPRMEATISSTVITVCSVASCWTRAPPLIL